MTPTHALKPELVPEPLWGLSAHNLLARSRWPAIRQDVLEQFGSRCAVCGERIQRGAICHEQWRYDEEGGVARLCGLILLCRPCNGVHHFGQASASGWTDTVLDHLVKVTGVRRDEARAVLRAAMTEWRARSRKNWTITVDPALLGRVPDLRALDGLSGKPGDGRRRQAQNRRRETPSRGH